MLVGSYLVDHNFELENDKSELEVCLYFFLIDEHV